MPHTYEREDYGVKNQTCAEKQIPQTRLSQMGEKEQKKPLEEGS